MRLIYDLKRKEENASTQYARDESEREYYAQMLKRAAKERNFHLLIHCCKLSFENYL